MWIVKGVSLGSAFFVVGTLVFLFFRVFWPVEASKATALSALTALTTRNPVWWSVLVAALVLGCVIVRAWPLRVPSLH